MSCRNLPHGIIGTLAFWELSDRHRRVLLFSSVTIFGFWFSLVRGCIYKAKPYQLEIVAMKREITCITCIIRILGNAENAKSAAVLM